MTQIHPSLSLVNGPECVELHIVDGYGQTQLAFELTPEQCREFSDLSQRQGPAQEARFEDMTKHEIVDYIRDTYGAVMDIRELRGELIEQAEAVRAWHRHDA